MLPRLLLVVGMTFAVMGPLVWGAALSPIFRPADTNPAEAAPRVSADRATRPSIEPTPRASAEPTPPASAEPAPPAIVPAEVLPSTPQPSRQSAVAPAEPTPPASTEPAPPAIVSAPSSTPQLSRQSATAPAADPPRPPAAEAALSAPPQAKLPQAKAPDAKLPDAKPPQAKAPQPAETDATMSLTLPTQSIPSQPPKARADGQDKRKPRKAFAGRPTSRASVPWTAEIIDIYEGNGPHIIVVCQNLTRTQQLRAGCR